MYMHLSELSPMVAVMLAHREFHLCRLVVHCIEKHLSRLCGVWWVFLS